MSAGTGCSQIGVNWCGAVGCWYGAVSGVYWLAPLRMWRCRAPRSLEGEPRAETGASPSIARLRLPRAEGEGTRSALLGGRLAVSSRGSRAATLPAAVKVRVGLGSGSRFSGVPHAAAAAEPAAVLHAPAAAAAHQSPASPPSPNPCLHPSSQPTNQPPTNRTCICVLLLPLRLLLCRRCHVLFRGLGIRPLLCRAQGRQVSRWGNAGHRISTQIGRHSGAVSRTERTGVFVGQGRARQAAGGS